MTKPPQPSAQSQTTLQILRQAVAKALDRKQRLGQYAVVWEDDQPVLTGGEVNALDTPSLQAEKRSVQEQHASLPASAHSTKTSMQARLQNIEAWLAQLYNRERLDTHDAR